jgi:transposase
MAATRPRSGKLFLDETPAPVLDPGRGRTKTGYLWALARDDRRWGGAVPPGVVYRHAPGRGVAHVRAALDGFSGVLQVDGYGADKTLRDARPPGTLILAHCRAHGRRKLREVFDRDASPMAEEGLRRSAELHRIEAAIAGLPPDARRSVRQTQSKPLVEDLGLWLASARARISTKSRRGRNSPTSPTPGRGSRSFSTMAGSRRTRTRSRMRSGPRPSSARTASSPVTTKGRRIGPASPPSSRPAG